MIRLLLVAFLFVGARSESDRVTVHTDKGPVRGYKSADGKYHRRTTTYFGVPYAKVDEDNPFGDTGIRVLMQPGAVDRVKYLLGNSYKNSQDHPKFVTPFNANDSSIRCPQAYFNAGGVLQCLILNIYVPNTTKLKSLPILVWFHGGGFAFGSGGEYGGQYLVQHDVIIITSNYRLGPYGFLCLDDPKAPGNQGLKDQISALRWIKKNIHAFGGDASKVTIAGESYGGGGVDLHLYSSYDTLFDKAIIQSGSILAQGFFKKPDYDAAIKLANQLGDNAHTTKEALAFLAKAKPIDVMEAAKNLSMLLTVCKEKSFDNVKNFITADPFHLNPNKIKTIPIMIGYNSKEDFVSFFNKTNDFYENLGNIILTKLKDNFVLSESKLDILSNIVKTFYLGSKDIGPESSLELSDLSSDFILNYPTEWSVNNYLRQGAKVFKYVFSYTNGSPYQNETGVGAYHTEELRYLFQWGSELASAEQRLMRNKMTTMWTNFVKFENPTPAKIELLPTTWKSIPTNGTSRPYLNIDVEMTMMDHVYRERMAFWDLFWQSYVDKAVVNDEPKRHC